MAVKNEAAVYIGGINYTHYLVVPVKWDGVLDDTLDSAVISLRHVPKKLFYSTLPVEIHITNTVYWGSTVDRTETKTLYYVISGDISEEAPVGSGLYDHEITLVEPTKMAELIVCDTITFTNDIGRVYTGNQVPVEPIVDE